MLKHLILAMDWYETFEQVKKKIKSLWTWYAWIQERKREEIFLESLEMVE